MSEAYTIRLAVANDIPALRALIPHSVRTLGVGHYTPRQIERALGPVFGVDGQLIADGTFYVAVAGAEGRIVGCGGWSKRHTLYGGGDSRAEIPPLLDPATQAAKLRLFFVDPGWTRRGIGRRIIEACEAAAQAAGFTRIELGATPMGEPLYAALGYAVTDRFAVELAEGERLPAVRMAKPLEAGGPA